MGETYFCTHEKTGKVYYKELKFPLQTHLKCEFCGQKSLMWGSDNIVNLAIASSILKYKNYPFDSLFEAILRIMSAFASGKISIVGHVENTELCRVPFIIFFKSRL